MEVIIKDINELKPYENNPRFNDEAVDYVVQSIKEFGFNNPIILDKNNVIICGHTRYRAAQKLNLTQVPCIVLTNLTDKQVRAFRIADNKCSDFSYWDNNLLLKELDFIGEDIFTGFNFNEFNFNGLITDQDPDSDVDVYDNNMKIESDVNENNYFYVINYKTKNKELYNAILELINKYEEK